MLKLFSTIEIRIDYTDSYNNKCYLDVKIKSLPDINRNL